MFSHGKVQPRGDFRCFVRDILKTHPETEATDWLAKLLDAGK
jgi:hypothetical protein